MMIYMTVKINNSSGMPNHTHTLIIAIGLLLAQGFFSAQAAEPEKSYSKAPMASYNYAMDDALLGNSYEKPVWNLHDTSHLPDWLTVGLENRTRYESLSDSFKANQKSSPAPGGDQQIALQTDLWVQAKFGKFRFATEFMDARALSSDSGTNNTPNPPNNTMVDTLDFTQIYASWADQNTLLSGLGTEVKAGRQTMDLGSRRLVARPFFRNAVNNFTGLRIRVLDYGRWQLNAFGTMPVLRFPNYTSSPTNGYGDPNLISQNANLLVNGGQQWDQEDTHTWFSGGILEGYDVIKNINTDLALYSLNESDSNNNATRNRQYLTPNIRFYSKPIKGRFDFVAEGMGQFGTVQYDTKTNNQQQNHQAWSNHLEAGYSFDLPMSPRFLVEYDWASGSKNSANKTGTDGRFDPLYGASDVDFGSSGIYSAFQRSNINSPGARFNFSPRKDITVSLQQRAIWLASAGDCWGGTSCTSGTLPGLVGNSKGTSGDYVGDQIGASSRYNFNSSLNFEAGWFHLFKGQCATTAVSSATTTQTTTSGGDTNYFYVQSQVRF